MNTVHIRSAFDRDLESAQALVMRMGGLVEAALLDASEALDARDDDLADPRAVTGDTAIDALEEQINAECARLIALRATDGGRPAHRPDGDEDRRGAGAVRATMRRTSPSGRWSWARCRRWLGASGSIRRLAKAVVQMLADALDAYIRRDVKLAEDVRHA